MPQIQYALACHDQRYPHWLEWQQNGEIIKATPKFRLPEDAHQIILRVFKRLGGKFVRHHGKAWFELVLEESGSRRLDVGAECTLSGNYNSPAPGPALKHCELTEEA